MSNLQTAIIDIGSNTVRLVLYTYNKEKGLHEVGNIKTVARLRTQLLDNGEMSEEGITLLAETLQSFKRIIDDHQVKSIKACATAAIRQATNRAQIIERMYEVTGIRINILSEEEEAYYGFVAVAHSMETPSAVTIDIGGGSTEITLYKNKKLQKTHSFPFGTVSLKQKFVKGMVIDEQERKALRSFVKKQFETLPWIKETNFPIVAIGGSARNVAQIHQQQTDYPISGVHQYEMAKDDMDDLIAQLGVMSYETLRQLDGLSSDRADIIVPAMEVFATLMQVVQTNSFQLSNKGLREGIIISEVLQKDLQAFDKYDVFEENAKRIASTSGRSLQETATLSRLAAQLYKECCKFKFFEYNENDLELITRAAKVYSIGEYVELESSSQHTFYILANQSISGLTHVERIKLALLASYKNRDYFRRFAQPFSGWITREELRKLRDFGALLKFVYALNSSKRHVVINLQLNQFEQEMEVHANVIESAVSELYQAERTKKHIERIFKQPVTIHFHE